VRLRRPPAGEVGFQPQRPVARRTLQQAGWDSSIPRRSVRKCGYGHGQQ
jgi:hypothetical protein